jgi:hypothetical protein
LRTQLTLMIAPVLALVACNSEPQPRDTGPKIAVRSAEQDALHQLNALDLSIALKRAIQTSGYSCGRVENAGFVAAHENLDMWTASCSEGRDWAIFAGPDGSAQVRDCVDVPRFGLPECKVSKQPKAAPTG